jgi:signal transduction histidine kinase
MTDRAHERYVEISQRVYAVSDIGAVVLTVAIVAASATSKSRFLLSLVLNIAMVAFNLAVNRWVVPKLGVRGDYGRMVANGLLTGVVYSAIDWPLPVWLWLPYVAIMLDQAAGSRSALWMVLLLSGIQSGAAILQGHRLLEPLVFSTFAVVCWAISNVRFGIVREMLANAEQDRDRLAQAHEQLVAEVAARERVELELRQAQKLEALGRLASGIAHEINTPMQFINNSVQFVREGVTDLLEGDESDRDYLREHLPNALALAAEGCERVAMIVRSMKLLAHTEGTHISVDLHTVIDATLAIVRHEYDAVADVERAFAKIPSVICNPGEINQVLVHLITNAAHAVETHDRRARGRITLRTRVEDDTVVISISDNGSGIPAHVRDRIFDPFFTTKAVGRGTGQGLSISRTMIERHGGTLTFETVVGRGTTFHLRLPVESTAQRAA